MVIGVLVGAEFAPDLGDFVTYIVGLGAAGAIVGRFAVDWFRRDERRPATLRSLTPEQRHDSDDDRSWALWLATISGAVGGVALGIVALVFDALSR